MGQEDTEAVAGGSSQVALLALHLEEKGEDCDIADLPPEWFAR